MTNFEYGYKEEIKKKVAGKASLQLDDYTLTKANRYASDIVNVETERNEGWNITVDQSLPPSATAGQITSSEPFANAVSAITEKLGAQLLRFNFNAQEAKSQAEWQQAIEELAKIKMNLAKLMPITSGKTIAYSNPSTFPANPKAQFVSGVRKKVQLWL